MPPENFHTAKLTLYRSTRPSEFYDSPINEVVQIVLEMSRHINRLAHGSAVHQPVSAQRRSPPPAQPPLSARLRSLPGCPSRHTPLHINRLASLCRSSSRPQHGSASHNHTATPSAARLRGPSTGTSTGWLCLATTASGRRISTPAQTGSSRQPRPQHGSACYNHTAQPIFLMAQRLLLSHACTPVRTHTALAGHFKPHII